MAVTKIKKRKKKQPPAPRPYALSDLAKLIKNLLAKGHDSYTVFGDFVEMSAISISNALRHDAELEKTYMSIVKKYDAESVNEFPKMLAGLVQLMETGFGDHLGDLFNSLELANKDRGQFFTPYHLSKLMAQLLITDDLKERAAKRGFVTLAEPASGSGGMIIAFCEAARNAGLDYQKQVHVEAWDVDHRAACMTYIQLSLLHVPAVVVCGNTLSREVRRVLVTPAHVLGGWDVKLKNAQREDRKRVLMRKLEKMKKRRKLARAK